MNKSTESITDDFLDKSELGIRFLLSIVVIIIIVLIGFSVYYWGVPDC